MNTSTEVDERLELLSNLHDEVAGNLGPVKLLESLEALENNPDFKRIITTGYFYEQPARIVGSLNLPEYETPERQASLQKQLNGIAALSEYFRIIRIQGDVARRNIETANNTIREVEAE